MTNSTLTADFTINDAATLAVNQSGTLTFSNGLTGGGTPQQALFNVMGSGTLDFSSASGSFNGLTTVSSGTLNITGSLGGNVNVSSGTLKGTGTAGGDVTIQSGGTLVGDYNTTPALTVSGKLTLDAGRR